MSLFSYKTVFSLKTPFSCPALPSKALKHIPRPYLFQRNIIMIFFPEKGLSLTICFKYFVIWEPKIGAQLLTAVLLYSQLPGNFSNNKFYHISQVHFSKYCFSITSSYHIAHALSLLHANKKFEKTLCLNIFESLILYQCSSWLKDHKL